VRVGLPTPRARGEAAVGAWQDRGRLERVDLERFAVAPRRLGRRASSASARWRNARTSCDWPTRSRSSARDAPFVGDGRCARSSRARRSHARRPRSARRDPGLLAESHVLCQPSLIEPLGQALLEGWPPDARSWRRGSAARRVRAARAGVLVDPSTPKRLRARVVRLRRCRPNAAARAAAAVHDVRREVERIEEILSRAAAAGRRA
jgi:hypothetical protein